MTDPTPPDQAPGCTWPVSYAECGPCDVLSTENKPTFEAMAADYLWNWTGRAYGLCDTTIRPCRDDCTRGVSTFWGQGPFPSVYGQGNTGYWPVVIGGDWLNLACGTCIGRCKCGDEAKTLRLPGPIASITKITIDGNVLDDSAYRVDNGRVLVRIDGDSWPKCQDLEAPLTDADTWSIQYDRGVAVPIGGQIAAGVLACEMAKAACNDSSCRLPARIQSITRQGVTIAVLDAFDGLERGQTGIWLIDSWVASLTQPKRGGQVYSVDVKRPRNRRVTP